MILVLKIHFFSCLHSRLNSPLFMKIIQKINFGKKNSPIGGRRGSLDCPGTHTRFDVPPSSSNWKRISEETREEQNGKRRACRRKKQAKSLGLEASADVEFMDAESKGGNIKGRVFPKQPTSRFPTSVKLIALPSKHLGDDGFLVWKAGIFIFIFIFGKGKQGFTLCV